MSFKNAPKEERLLNLVTFTMAAGRLHFDASRIQLSFSCTDAKVEANFLTRNLRKGQLASTWNIQEQFQEEFRKLFDVHKVGLTFTSLSFSI